MNPQTFLCSLALTAVLFMPSSVFAERNSQVGEISQYKEEKKADPYELAQDRAIKLFSTALAKDKQLQSGNAYTPDKLPKDSLLYLAANHLKCTLRTGHCRPILEGLYETEVIRSVALGKASCRNLTLFWKQWVEADMERRLDLDLKIALLDKHNSFKASSRRKYLACSKSVGKLLESAKGNEKELLKTRYAEGSEGLKKLAAAQKYLERVKAKIPNIFSQIGVRR